MAVHLSCELSKAARRLAVDDDHDGVSGSVVVVVDAGGHGEGFRAGSARSGWVLVITVLVVWGHGEANTYGSAAHLMQSLTDWDSERRLPQPGQL